MRRRSPRVTMLGAGSARGKDFSALERDTQNAVLNRIKQGSGAISPPDPVKSSTATQTLVLEDFPDPRLARALSPNGRAHWATRKRARAQVVQAVVLATIGRGLVEMHGPVRITYRWLVPDRRRRDLDNHSTGVVKVIQDCLVVMRLIDADDTSCVVGITTEIVYERGRRALEIEIREA